MTKEITIRVIAGDQFHWYYGSTTFRTRMPYDPSGIFSEAFDYMPDRGIFKLKPNWYLELKDYTLRILNDSTENTSIFYLLFREDKTQNYKRAKKVIEEVFEKQGMAAWKELPDHCIVQIAFDNEKHTYIKTGVTATKLNSGRTSKPFYTNVWIDTSTEAVLTVLDNPFD